MTIKHLLGVCVLAASIALAAAGSASALIYEQVYTGTVKPGIAGGELFGGITGGEAFTVRFVTDTSLGLGITDVAGGQSIEGGSNSGTTAPVSAFVNVNGHAYSFVDDIAFSRSQIISNAGQFNLTHTISYGNGADFVDILSWILGPDIGHSATFGQPYEISSLAGYSPSLFLLGRIADHGFFVEMNMTSAYGRVISAAPEPGTWALMIAGFGLAGATLRRRQTITAA